MGPVDRLRRDARRGPGLGRIHVGRDGSHLQYREVQARAAARSVDGVSRVLAGGSRAALRSRPAGPVVASAGDVESALGDVRGRVVRDALHDGAVSGIPAGGAGEIRMASSNGVDPSDLGAADDSRRVALDAPPELAGLSVPDCAFEAVPAVVLPDSAAALLYLGDRGGAGDDDLRIVAQQPRVRARAGAASA